MLRTCLFAFVAFCLIAVAAHAQVAQPKFAGTSPNTHQLPPWRVPDIAGLSDDNTGRMVHYGRDLIEHTTALIGPDAPNEAQRYSGNGLECTNCHIDAGTSRFALPLVGIAGLYPQFSARMDAAQDLAGRVNDCMERSLNGRPLPLDSREMQALLAYLKFLGSDQPAGQAPVGRGAPVLPLPTRAADPRHGAIIYQNVRAACHQSNGLGVRLQGADQAFEKRRYLYPPLWGPESYNDAAGMAPHRDGCLVRARQYAEGRHLPVSAADRRRCVRRRGVCGYTAAPRKTGLAKDYPDLWLKPIGMPYPPWAGNFSAMQNKYGPWQPILAWQQRNAPPTGSKGPPAANDLEQPLHAVVAR